MTHRDSRTTRLKEYITEVLQWASLYRAVDTDGQTVDALLSELRDIAAAERFFQQAVEQRGIPQKITLDGYAASHEAIAELRDEDTLPLDLAVRTSKGFKRFDYAAVTISGIELVHQIKKGQFDVSAICAPQTRIPQVWKAVLAA